MGIKKRLTQSKEDKTYHTDILVALQAYEDTGMTHHEIEMMRDGKYNQMQEDNIDPDEAYTPSMVKYVLLGWFKKTMRQRRKCVGMSIEYLAELCGTNYNTIRLMETKDGYAVIEGLVCKVCNVLGLTASWDQLQAEAMEIKEG